MKKHGLKKIGILKWLAIMCFLFLISLSYSILQEYQHSIYDIKDNNCLDMSFEYAKNFRKLGLKSYVACGCNNESPPMDCHAWVIIKIGEYTIQFESTNLEFKNVRMEYPYTYFEYTNESLYR